MEKSRPPVSALAEESVCLSPRVSCVGLKDAWSERNAHKWVLASFPPQQPEANDEASSAPSGTRAGHLQSKSGRAESTENQRITRPLLGEWRDHHRTPHDEHGRRRRDRPLKRSDRAGRTSTSIHVTREVTREEDIKQVSFNAFKHVAENRRVRGAARCVLFVLAGHADPQGRSFPGIAKIAREANCSERFVRRTLAELRLRGEVSVTPGGGRRQTNTYHLPLGNGQAILGESLNTAPPPDARNDGAPFPPPLNGGSTNPEPRAPQTSNNRKKKHHHEESEEVWLDLLDREVPGAKQSYPIFCQYCRRSRGTPTRKGFATWLKSHPPVRPAPRSKWDDAF